MPPFLTSLWHPLTYGDQILIGVLVGTGLLSLWMLSFVQSSGDEVQIFVDNHLKYQYELNTDSSHIIETEQGSMEIRIAGRKVWVERSSCPAKICIKMGKISRTGQAIVCVPNHVLIQISGSRVGQWIDVITR